MPDVMQKARSWIQKVVNRENPEEADALPEEKNAGKKSLFPWLAFLLGVCGILLFSLGDCSQAQTESEIEIPQTSLEESIVRLVAAISGDSKPAIALTYSQNEEYLYAFDERQTAAGSEREVALYEDASGREQGLLQTIRAPEVAGIAIACRNGTDASVRLRVTEAVATALRISTDQVYVTAKSAD